MRKLFFSLVLFTSLPATAVSLAAEPGLAAPKDNSLAREVFSVDGSTAIPGATLKTGTYVIRMTSHFSDRSILRIENESGKVLSTFLAVPIARPSDPNSGGPIEWTGGSGDFKALRGFNFPGSFSVEFVYPKADAVKIAVAHSSQVEAMDPESDNLPTKQKKLMNDDLRMLTLWTLSPTKVDGRAAIAAEKYKAPAALAEPEVVVAKNEPPASPADAVVAQPAPAASAAPTTSTDAGASPAPKPVARRRPIVAALPHTASELPSVLLGGLLSLMGIVTLRVRRNAVRN